MTDLASTAMHIVYQYVSSSNGLRVAGGASCCSCIGQQGSISILYYYKYYKTYGHGHCLC